MWHKRVFWIVLGLTAIAIVPREVAEYDGTYAWLFGLTLSLVTGLAINALIMYVIWIGVRFVSKAMGRR